MRCIECGRDSKKSDRLSHSGHCPSCRHPFVTAPEMDRITDVFVKNAEDSVSGNGTFYYLLAHLKYEITRRLLRKASRWKKFGVASFGVSLCSMPLAALDARILILSGVLLAISAACFVAAGNSVAVLSRLGALLQKWERLNPNEHLLAESRQRVRELQTTGKADLGNVSFDRVLICDRDEYVDFFLANLFHFHYSCPVLGGSGYPPDVCSDMLQRLKANPNLEVYLIHDFSPAGLEFVRNVTTSPQWFGGGEAAAIIDLGLTEEQGHLFSALQVQSGMLSSYSQQAQEAKLTMFRPEVLIRMCGLSLGEQVAFHLLPNNEMYDHGGYG